MKIARFLDRNPVEPIALRNEAEDTRKVRRSLTIEEARRLLAGSDALLLTSLLEGGANVVSEAIVCGVPVLSTSIEGSIGMLGEDHPGFFPVGDEAALARLLEKVERDDALRADLAERSRRLQPEYAPERERQAWHDLLADLAP